MPTTHTAAVQVKSLNIFTQPVEGSPDVATANVTLFVTADPANSGAFANAAGQTMNLNLPNVSQPLDIQVGSVLVLSLTAQPVVSPNQSAPTPTPPEQAAPSDNPLA